MLGTVPVKAAERNNKLLNNKIDALPLNGKKEYCFECGTVDLDKSIDDDVGSTTLIINEDKMTKQELKRLDHWRMVHWTSSGERYDEQCQCCEQSKHKSQYKRNARYNGTSISTNKPYWGLYSDGYGSRIRWETYPIRVRLGGTCLYAQYLERSK